MNSFEYIQASHIANQTQNAVGRRYYSDKAWMSCIEFLFEQGETQEYILWMLGSKHMEWASLGSFPDQRDQAFTRYYFRHATRIEVSYRQHLCKSLI